MPFWSYSLGDEVFRILPEISTSFFQLSDFMMRLFHNHFGCLLAAVCQGLYYDVDAFLKTALLSAAY